MSTRYHSLNQGSLHHSPWYTYSYQTRLQMHFCRISLWHHPEATRRFFTTTSTSKLDPDSYETQLKTLMQTLQPPTVHKQREQNSYVNTDLTLCSFVFIRHGAVKKPLQPPYDGPFKVLQWTNKHFYFGHLWEEESCALRLPQTSSCGHITNSRCII